MEYVGGSSLKQIMEARRRDDGHLEPLPVAQAIAYALEVLPALGYLHGQGLAYCDFKPDNVIQYDRQLKLIDLGAVIRIDDEDSPIYGTVGYQAPEVARRTARRRARTSTPSGARSPCSPSASARRSAARRPSCPTTTRVLPRYESFHRLLLRATDPDPLRRFALHRRDRRPARGRAARGARAGRRAGPARDVHGVLRAPRRVRRRPASARRRPADPTRRGWRRPCRCRWSTPPTRPPPSSPPRSRDAGAAAGARRRRSPAPRCGWRWPGPSSPRATRTPRSSSSPPRPPTTPTTGASTGTGASPRSSPTPGRRRRRVRPRLHTLPRRARARSSRSPSPRSARATTTRARRYYALLARIEPSLADAAFGLARTALRAGRPGRRRRARSTPCPTRPAGTSPRSSRPSTRRCAGRTGAEIGDADLRGGGGRVLGLPLDPRHRRRRCARRSLDAAVELVAAQRPATGRSPLLGRAWQERDLRLGAGALPAHARRGWPRTCEERVALVDRANAARPRTWTMSPT